MNYKKSKLGYNKLDDSRNKAFRLFEEGNYEDSAREFEAIFKYKKTADIANNIGVSRRKSGQPLLAIKAFHQAIGLQHDYATAYHNIACTLMDVGDLIGAKLNLDKAISYQPKVWQYHAKMGDVLQLTNNFEMAIIYYRRAIELNKGVPSVLGNLARCLVEINEWDKAADLYLLALALEPAEPIYLNGLGVIYKQKGDFERAVKYFELALDESPYYISCLRNYSSIPGEHINLNFKQKLDNLKKQRDITKSDQSALFYALYGVCDHLGLYQEAFDHLHQGAKLKNEILGYNINDDKNLFKLIIQLSEDIDDVETCQYSGDKYQPIFIVGMPRSGTTLVEQIITSSPAVTGFGETGWLSIGMTRVFNEGKVSGENISYIRDSYNSFASKRLKNNLIFTDKMPLNFRFIPFIAKAFPEAKVIHVYRDAPATCWSNYSNFFSGMGLGYSYDLDNCVEFFELYKDMMKVWQDRFPEIIFNLDYDELVSSKESVITQLYSFLGLELTDAAFTPEKNSNPVKTVSSVQVNKPIYAGSSTKWLRYESMLGDRFGRLKKYNPTRLE